MFYCPLDYCEEVGKIFMKITQHLFQGEAPLSGTRCRSNEITVDDESVIVRKSDANFR